ncbi:hypothetical protein AOLI_G00051560 [Acnodon oligacanthus]
MLSVSPQAITSVSSSSPCKQKGILEAKHVRLWKISSCQKRGRYDILFLLQPSVPPPAGCSLSAGVKRCPPLTFKRGPRGAHRRVPVP